MKQFDGLLLIFSQKYINGFWKKVDKRSDDECWEWLGAKSDMGYGYYGVPIHPAHRISYVLFYGKLPSNLYVCHHCDNPSCVNPKHLFSGSMSDNMRDRNNKGRSNLPSGERHHNSKLTELDIREIRSAYQQRLFSRGDLSLLYNVSVSNIRDIVIGKAWKNVK